MSKWGVLLVDDNAAIRAGRRLFDVHPDFEICGEAEHGREAVEKAPTLQPEGIHAVVSGSNASTLLIAQAEALA